MKKLKIGNITLRHPTVLAPMEAVNSYSFIKTCAHFNAGLVMTQAIESSDKNFYDMQQLKEITTPTGFQIMSRKEEEIKTLISDVEDYVDIIDINMGCPLKPILGDKKGGYIMQYPQIADKLMKWATESTNKSVSVKLRTGFDSSTHTCFEIAKLAEDRGISAVTIHGRTVRQGYTGKANWEIIKQTHQKINIPVIANGDIFKAGHAKTILEQDYANGVMLGRMAKNHPAIFDEIARSLENKPIQTISKYDEFSQLYRFFKEEKKQSLQELQDHACWILRGHPEANSIKTIFRKTTTTEELLSQFKALTKNKI